MGWVKCEDWWSRVGLDRIGAWVGTRTVSTGKSESF